MSKHGDLHDKDKHDKGRHDGARKDEAELAAREGARLVAKVAPQAPEIIVDGVPFDLDDPAFPAKLEQEALASGGYPYPERMKRKDYERELTLLQIELVKLQSSVAARGQRVVILFEGRDAAGKGGSIDAFKQNLNPRRLRAVALPKPSDTERGQWYFQRYAAQLPTAGEIVLFDRSWYNRAGVERVLNFATEQQVRGFFDQAPHFERQLVSDGIVLVKFWLDIGRDMQLKRFHDRRHDPLRVWKLSPVDIQALPLWHDYSRARDDMISATHTAEAPWTVVRANDKRRTHLNEIRYVLNLVDYEDKCEEAIGAVDPQVLGQGPAFPVAR